MCIRVVEKYAICLCVYYRHAVNPCPAYDERGHKVKIKEVLVGYCCSRHSTDGGGKASVSYSEGSTVRSENSKDQEESAEDEDGSKTAAVEVVPDFSLRGQLLKKMQKIMGTHERFIPAGDLDEVLTNHAIVSELQSHGLADISQRVFRHAKKIFAILLMIRKLDVLEDVIKKGLHDEILPLARPMPGSLEDENLDSIFSGWNLDTRRQFMDFQWTLLAPVFLQGEHLKLPDDARLPFMKTEVIANGAFGVVHRVEIHSDHARFDKLEMPVTKQVHVFALKQFTRDSEEVNRRAFDRELAVMRSMGSSNHDHIMKILGTFEHRGLCSMILPLAEENLRQFWARVEPSSLTPLWCLEEMHGVAAGLSFLHNGIPRRGSETMSWAHMDLKPENILIFDRRKTSDIGVGRWILSDFGLSRIRTTKESELELLPHPGLGTYEPPECQLSLPQSPASDIWSFGCILVECVAYMMRGSDAIEAFAEDRLNDVTFADSNFRDDNFFTLEFNEQLEPSSAMTRPAVIKWIEDLDRDPDCSKAISALLLVIRDGLLQVDRSKRLSASNLSERLLFIHQTTKQYLSSNREPILQATPERQITELED